MSAQHGCAGEGSGPHASPTLDHGSISQRRKQALSLSDQIIKLAIRLICRFKVPLTGRSNGHSAIQMRHHMQPLGKKLSGSRTGQIQQGRLPLNSIADLFAQSL